MAPTKEHLPIFNDLIKLASFHLYLMGLSEDEAEKLEPDCRKLLTEWWTPAIEKNINKRGVKEELSKSLAQHIKEK